MVDKYGFNLKNTLKCLVVELYLNPEILDKLLTKRSLIVKRNLINSRYHGLIKLNQDYSKKHNGFMSPELSSEADNLFQNLVNIEKRLDAMNSKSTRTLILDNFIEN